MQMWRCGSGEALTCGSVEMRKRGSVEVWKRGSVEVWKCRSVEVWKCGSVEVWTEEAKTGKSHRKRKNRDKAPLRYVPLKFSDRAGPGSHNGYTRGFPTNGVYTLKLQMEGANLSSTTDES